MTCTKKPIDEMTAEEIGAHLQTAAEMAQHILAVSAAIDRCQAAGHIPLCDACAEAIPSRMAEAR